MSMIPKLAMMLAARALLACGSEPATEGPGGAPSNGGGGAGGIGPGGAAGTAGAGGTGPSALDVLLEALRADLHGAMLAQSRAAGWPAPVEQGRLFVSTDPALARVAGDHDGWTGTALLPDAGFGWVVIASGAGDHYKLTDGGDQWVADPWARAFEYDEHGEMSRVAPVAEAHLERHLEVGFGPLEPRTLRVWVPAETAERVLYVHDGQNLFDPAAPWGGWRLQESAPPAMLLVGIDNTAARMDEYTHVPDDLGDGPVGGAADAYADLVEQAVRPLVAEHYGEPAVVGVMGSSLGGLVSLYLADRDPDGYRFAASLSGTLGWGSIGPAVHNTTIIERYAAAGHRATALYIDSGGGGSCLDADQDGIDDDSPDATDNYCENKQMEAVLQAIGYVQGEDLWHWHEPGAAHDEAAWAARVFRPLEVFDAL